MDRLISEVSKRLALAPSRRGFLATLGKAAVIVSGAGALAVSQSSDFAFASSCCTGPSYCGSSCPPGTTDKWSWACCNPSTITYCHDCYSGGTLQCVAVQNTIISCNAPHS